MAKKKRRNPQHVTVADILDGFMDEALDRAQEALEDTLDDWLYDLHGANIPVDITQHHSSPQAKRPPRAARPPRPAPVPPTKTHYDTLEVSHHASDATIKAAYRSLALSCHPDRHPGDKAAENKFKDIGEAYGVLSDAQKRAQYDRSIGLRHTAR